MSAGRKVYEAVEGFPLVVNYGDGEVGLVTKDAVIRVSLNDNAVLSELRDLVRMMEAENDS